MASPALAEHLSRCIDLYFEPSYPSSTLREVLSVAHNPACYPKDLVPAVHANEELTRYVFRTDFLQSRFQEWISESPKDMYNPAVILERIFTLLGRQASRNLIGCIEMQRITHTLPKKPGERLSVRPSEQLRYAIAAEEFCQARGFASSEQAFVGGLQFDLLNAAFLKQRGPRDVIGSFAQVFSESLRAAHMAYEIGTRLGEFRFNSLLFPAALSVGLGKLLISGLFPKELATQSYTSFLAEGEKLKEGKWHHLEFRELPRFGTRVTELASLYVSWMELLGEAESSIRYMNEPHYLKLHSPNHMRLACVIQLAQALAQGSPFTEKHRRSLRTLNLSESEISKLRALPRS